MSRRYSLTYIRQVDGFDLSSPFVNATARELRSDAPDDDSNRTTITMPTVLRIVIDTVSCRESGTESYDQRVGGKGKNEKVATPKPVVKQHASTSGPHA